MGGCHVSAAIQPPPGSGERRENTNCQRRRILDVGDHMQTATALLAQYSRKSAPGLMTHEWAHERAAQ